MKITAQEEYGLRCLLRLSEAEGQSLTLPDLAAAEGLSIPYVAKLMAVLKQAGLVDSERGRTGGYRLAKPPAEIGLGSLLLQLGEPLFDEPSYCQKHAGQAEDGVCVHQGACSLRALWQTLEQLDARHPRPDHPGRSSAERRRRSPNCCVPSWPGPSSRTRRRC